MQIFFAASEVSFTYAKAIRNERIESFSAEGVPEMLFNLPVIVGFPRKGTNVSERDTQVDEETVVIAQYSTYFNKEINEMPICYTKNNKLGIPRAQMKVYHFTLTSYNVLRKMTFLYEYTTSF